MTEQDRREFLKRMVGVAGAFTAPTVLSFGLSSTADASPPMAAIAQGSNVTTNSATARPLTAFIPRLVAPPAVYQGELFTVSAYDMPLEIAIKFYLEVASGSPFELGSTTAGGDGSLTTSLTMPTDAPVGPHRLEARSNPLIAATDITVLAVLPSDSAATPSSQADPAATPETELAFTGSTTDSLLSTGLGLIAAGAAALGTRARRLRRATNDSAVKDADPSID